MLHPSWYLDELAQAVPAHLDADHVGRRAVKAGPVTESDADVETLISSPDPRELTQPGGYLDLRQVPLHRVLSDRPTGGAVFGTAAGPDLA